jgi:hypothetical protein
VSGSAEDDIDMQVFVNLNVNFLFPGESGERPRLLGVTCRNALLGEHLLRGEGPLLKGRLGSSTPGVNIL